jgi:N-acetylglutamate synthase-like GNAT family acetyltransferase
MASWSSMMPAHGSEAQRLTRLRAKPIDESDFDGLAFFLAGAGLPTSDLREAGRIFYRIEANDLVGYGGLEGEGSDRLLRSLVLLPDRRHVGMGSVVLALIEDKAGRAGVERLHLLTTTAARFFRTHGYANAVRATAPATIATSTEFARLCPASADYLVKHLKVPS